MDWTESRVAVKKKTPQKKKATEIVRSKTGYRIAFRLMRKRWSYRGELLSILCYVQALSRVPKGSKRKKHEKNKKGHSSIWHPWMLKRSKVSSKKKKKAEIEFLGYFPANALRNSGCTIAPSNPLMQIATKRSYSSLFWEAKSYKNWHILVFLAIQSDLAEACVLAPQY